MFDNFRQLIKAEFSIMVIPFGRKTFVKEVQWQIIRWG